MITTLRYAKAWLTNLLEQQPKLKPEKLRILEHLKMEAPVIVEAGAHRGNDTRILAKMYPKGRIFAFEPDPENYYRLKIMVAGQKNVTTIEQALGAENGSLSFYRSAQNFGASNSLLKPKKHLENHPDIQFASTITVPVLGITEFYKKYNLNQVDFFWLDMQGYEFQALQPAAELLKKTKLIYTEVNFDENFEGTVLYPQYRDWLIGLGFEVVYEDHTSDDMGNVLFRNSNV